MQGKGLRCTWSAACIVVREKYAVREKLEVKNNTHFNKITEKMDKQPSESEDQRDFHISVATIENILKSAKVQDLMRSQMNF